MTSLNAKDVALDYTNSIWNTKEIHTIDRLLHPNVTIHSLLGQYTGPQAMKAVVLSWLKAFPDLKVSFDHVITQDELVCIQWHAQGTHLGEFKGRLPTNLPVAYSGVTIYRIQEGKITEYWAYLDMQHLLSQI